jgi:SPP1 gp7 family putative phage head morphogenesis protein
MSALQFLTDATTRHAVFLQRFAGGRSKEALRMLNRIKHDINARLAQEPTVFQRNRLESVLKDINEITSVGFKDITVKVDRDMKDFAPVEAQYSTNLFNKVSTVDFELPADDQLISAVMTQTMAVQRGVAVTIDDALVQFGKQKALQVAAIIADGVTLGDTTPTISRKVGVVIDTLQRRQLDTLVRTATNHTSSISRQQVYNANADLMEGYQWIATLDSRTTLICGTRDKKVFQSQHGPMPPAHWGCRSTTIPKLKPQFDLGASVHGKRPSRGGDGFEQVSARVTYGGWLKKQPEVFVDEALGVERSKLFRSGKLSLDKFIDPTGRTYTLKELASMDTITMIQ